MQGQWLDVDPTSLKGVNVDDKVRLYSQRLSSVKWKNSMQYRSRLLMSGPNRQERYYRRRVDIRTPHSHKAKIPRARWLATVYVRADALDLGNPARRCRCWKPSKRLGRLMRWHAGATQSAAGWLDEWRKDFTADTDGAFLCLRGCCLPDAAKQGRIINTCRCMNIRSPADASAYAKHAWRVNPAMILVSGCTRRAMLTANE